MKKLEKMNISSAWAGGGSNGCLQVGYGLYFQERGIKFNLMTSTSTGNLQAPMYALGDFYKCEQLWREIEENSDIYKHWTLSYLEGIFRKGIYNTSPLEKLINHYVDAEALCAAKQRFISCSINLNTGKKAYVEAVPANIDIIKKFILASAAFPVFFPPVYHNGCWFWDGGAREPIPARKMVEERPKEDLYILCLTSPKDGGVSLKADIGATILPFIGRLVEIIFAEIHDGDFKDGLDKYWAEDKFIVLAPTKEQVPFSDSLEFDKSAISKGIETGYEIARKTFEKAGL